MPFGQAKTAMPKAPKVLNDTPKVNEYMRALEHPLKAEMEAVRAIILNAHPGVTEGIKWNAPSFYYKGDMAVFNPRAQEYVHIVFPNGIIIRDDTGLLEGDYVDRRMAYFYDMDDVNAKKAALEKVILGWINVMDATIA
jgi:hypothetical protein